MEIRPSFVISQRRLMPTCKKKIIIKKLKTVFPHMQKYLLVIRSDYRL